MVAIIGILCLLLVWQILKIILKKGIINKNKIDYVLEYIVFIIYIKRKPINNCSIWHNI